MSSIAIHVQKDREKHLQFIAALCCEILHSTAPNYTALHSIAPAVQFAVQYTCSLMQCSALSTVQYDTARCDAVRCDAIRSDPIRSDTIRYDTIQ